MTSHVDGALARGKARLCHWLMVLALWSDFLQMSCPPKLLSFWDDYNSTFRVPTLNRPCFLTECT